MAEVQAPKPAGYYARLRATLALTKQYGDTSTYGRVAEKAVTAYDIEHSKRWLEHFGDLGEARVLLTLIAEFEAVR